MHDAIWRKEYYYEKPLKMTTYENIYHSNSFNVNANNRSASVFNSPEQVVMNNTNILLAFCEFFPTTTDNLVKTAILSRLYI